MTTNLDREMDLGKSLVGQGRGNYGMPQMSFEQLREREIMVMDGRKQTTDNKTVANYTNPILPNPNFYYFNQACLLFCFQGCEKKEGEAGK